MCAVLCSPFPAVKFSISRRHLLALHEKKPALALSFAHWLLTRGILLCAGLKFEEHVTAVPSPLAPCAFLRFRFGRERSSSYHRTDDSSQSLSPPALSVSLSLSGLDG